MMRGRFLPLGLRPCMALSVCSMTLCIGAAKAPAKQSGIDAPVPVTLDILRDRYRPVLVFAPSTTRTFIQQMRMLAQGGTSMHERNVITVPLLLHDDKRSWGVVFNGNDDIGEMPQDEQAAARRRFHIRPNHFTVILIGKDGGEKLRSHQPISLDTLRSTIDAMPMRQEEMRSKNKP